MFLPILKGQDFLSPAKKVHFQEPRYTWHLPNLNSCNWNGVQVLQSQLCRVEGKSSSNLEAYNKQFDQEQKLN